VRDEVAIREVGMREGLQSDPTVVPTDVKIELARTLLAAGVESLNAAALVNPQVMPQMADAEELLEGLGPVEATVSVLVPNARGMARALDLHAKGLVDEVHLINSMTAGVLRANGLEITVEQRMEEVAVLADRAAAAGMRVAVFVSSAFGCSIQGSVPEDDVLRMVESLLSTEAVSEIVISDSTGQADPGQVSTMAERVASLVGSFPITVHLHDSRGAGSANALAALLSPLENLTLDCAFGGWGGDVPFIPEAAGNLATEDLCEMLFGMGIRTGIDVEKVAEASRRLSAETGRAIEAKVVATGPVGWKHADAGVAG